MGGMKSLWLQTPQQLADHLRSFRQARGLTQAGLGRLVGLDQTRIAKIERDPRVVSFGQLMQLLAVLEVRILLQPVGSGDTAPERDAREESSLVRDGPPRKWGSAGRRRSPGKTGAAGKVHPARRAADSDEPVEW